VSWRFCARSAAIAVFHYLLLADPTARPLFTSRRRMITGHETWGPDIRWHTVSARKPNLSATSHKFACFLAI
jgi:hypothetical protein